MTGVFQAVYAGAYDALYADKDYPGECDMFEALVAEFGAERPVRLLDLGCGTGNHAIPLAERGYEVTGIDRSPGMLARAREKARAAGASTSLVFNEGDVRDVRLDDGPYDAAIMMFAVLSYQQTDDDIRAALSTVRAHLAPGGVFIFDIWYRPGVLFHKPDRRERVIETQHGKIVRRAESNLDKARSLCSVRYDLDRWDKDELVESVHEQHVMRFFSLNELDRFAMDCGFAFCTLRCFPDWRAPADDTTWTAVGIFRAT